MPQAAQAGAASKLALRGCNGPEWPNEEAQEADYNRVLAKVAKLLYPKGDDGSPAVFINRDPRGYALKINDTTMREAYPESPLHRDWGGYGIIAPDLSNQ